MVRPTPRGNRGQINSAAIETEFEAAGDFRKAVDVPAIVAIAAAPVLSPAERDWDLALTQVKPEPQLTPDVLDQLLFVAENPRLAERLGTTRELISAGVYQPVGSTMMPDPDKVLIVDAAFIDKRGAKHERSRKTDGDRDDITTRTRLRSPVVEL